MMYNKIVEECFFNPQHVGVLDVATPYTVCSRLIVKAQGVRVELYIGAELDGTLAAIRYKAIGSPYLIAILEWIARGAQGHSVNGLEKIDSQMIMSSLDIPNESFPEIIQVVQLYKEALGLLFKKLEVSP